MPAVEASSHSQALYYSRKMPIGIPLGVAENQSRIWEAATAVAEQLDEGWESELLPLLYPSG